MSKSNDSSTDELKTLLQKVQGSLIPEIERHVGEATEFSSTKDDLDYLTVKNKLLLSYLIDLTWKARSGQEIDDDGNSCTKRLTEMRTVMEKMRPLEKKMRYQLDKLLTLDNTSSNFATAGDQQDPLSYRPNPEALKNDDKDGGLSSDDDDDDDSSKGGSEDDEDDLAAARKTLRKAKVSKKNKEDAQSPDDGVYRAPRHAAVPFPSHDASKEAKEKRLNRNLRTSELARALRDEYGEQPESQDMHGGSDYGQQKQASRRFAEMERQQKKFEEEHLIRLTTSRKQKKERQRLLREEGSNLSAISDIGNIARSVNAAFDQSKSSKEASNQYDDTFDDKGSGKRKKKRGMEAKNALQQALFASDSNDSGMKKKSKKKKRF